MESIAIRGHVDTFLVSPENVSTHILEGNNTVSYACADAAARLFAGRDGRPRTVAFVYAESSGLESSFGFTAGERDKTQEDIVGSGLSVANVAIDPNPSLSLSEAGKYAGNVATFHAVTTENSAPVYVYGYLLKDGEGRVLAVRKLESAVSKPAGYALAVSWAITFL